MENLTGPYASLLVIAAVLAIPFFVVSTTSFIKIAVVLLIVRNALGIQQAPPNMAIYAVAIVLSVFVMAPVGDGMLQAAAELEDIGAFGSIEQFLSNSGRLFVPLTEFLKDNTSPGTTQIFADRATMAWPEDFRARVEEDSALILVPAFLLSELTSAFKMGILIYLPFVIVDLVVANVLTALGMMMVSPTMISVPFKLLLFVAIDGWFRLMDSLILSYALAA